MLPETITLNYDPTGGSTPGNVVYDKKTHDENRAFYREHDALASNSPLQDSILLRIEEAKRSAASYGTTRHYLTIRGEESILTPSGGETITPILLKVEGSCPVGFSATGKRAIFERLKALLAHSEFENFFFNHEC